MKLSKIFIALTFILVFAGCISAQINQFPNELTGYKFFGSGKLNNLKLLVSDKDSVKMIFGEKCENGCDYDEDWKVGFSYVNNGWFRKVTENGNERVYKPKSLFIGKLAGISFRPKRQILLSESILIPKEFKCYNGVTTKSNFTFSSRVCVDDKRMSYVISNETTTDGKFLKGQIISIDYVSSQKEDDEIFVLSEQ